MRRIIAGHRLVDQPCSAELYCLRRWPTPDKNKLQELLAALHDRLQDPEEDEVVLINTLWAIAQLKVPESVQHVRTFLLGAVQQRPFDQAAWTLIALVPKLAETVLLELANDRDRGPWAQAILKNWKR